MMIQVLFHGDDIIQEIPDYVLGKLIDNGKIQGFRRSSGWVQIGRDPVREPGKPYYHGPERRARKMKSCLLCPDMAGGTCTSNTCPDRYKQIKIITCDNLEELRK